MIFLHIVLGLLMIAAGVFHFVRPEFYAPIIPSFINEQFANIAGGIAEIIIGVLLLIPSMRTAGGLGFMILMIMFLPLHVWDVFRDDPVMKTQTGAIVRLVIQFALIYYGYINWKG